VNNLYLGFLHDYAFAYNWESSGFHSESREIGSGDLNPWKLFLYFNSVNSGGVDKTIPDPKVLCHHTADPKDYTGTMSTGLS